MTWLGDFRRDCSRYEGNPLRHQGLWALLQYRVAHSVYERNPHSKWLPLPYVWRKGTEIATNMSLPHAARLGPGLVLGHVGPIVVSREAMVGSDCGLMQGVTLGRRSGGEKKGAPSLGNGVFVGVNAVVYGRITVGDGANIGALSYVDKDVPANGVVRGRVMAGD